jgi:hypothetical protein
VLRTRRICTIALSILSPTEFDELSRISNLDTIQKRRSLYSLSAKRGVPSCKVLVANSLQIKRLYFCYIVEGHTYDELNLEGSHRQAAGGLADALWISLADDAHRPGAGN